MQFDKFTPYLPKHNILFNIYSQLIKQRPVVIWFNGNEGMYYFVKAHSANKDKMEKDHFSTEILITTDATTLYSLFKKNSLIDYSQIFRMDEKEFKITYGKDNFPRVDNLLLLWLIK